MELAISTTTNGEQTVVRVVGEIDVYTAPALRRELDEHILGGCRDLVVDLGGVSFMDSTGLGVLVGRLKLIRSQGGSMVICEPQERVLKVFSITGLDRVFDIVDPMSQPPQGR